MGSTAPAGSPTKSNLHMPMPPPQIHARPANGFNEPSTPTTPTRSAFISPPQTPQGSPSKKQHPPGANDLPNIFDNALKLNPTAGNPNKIPYYADAQQRTALSEYPANDFRSSVIQDSNNAMRGIRSNQENTPPGMRFNKDAPVTRSQAAISRHDPYKPRDDGPPRTPRGLSTQDLEKCQKPSVKRLANVTQLCM